jgi:hypothetical protein
MCRRVFRFCSREPLVGQGARGAADSGRCRSLRARPRTHDESHRCRFPAGSWRERSCPEGFPCLLPRLSSRPFRAGWRPQPRSAGSLARQVRDSKVSHSGRAQEGCLLIPDPPRLGRNTARPPFVYCRPGNDPITARTAAPAACTGFLSARPPPRQSGSSAPLAPAPPPAGSPRLPHCPRCPCHARPV